MDINATAPFMEAPPPIFREEVVPVEEFAHTGLHFQVVQTVRVGQEEHGFGNCSGDALAVASDQAPSKRGRGGVFLHHDSIALERQLDGIDVFSSVKRGSFQQIEQPGVSFEGERTVRAHIRGGMVESYAVRLDGALDAGRDRDVPSDDPVQDGSHRAPFGGTVNQQVVRPEVVSEEPRTVRVQMILALDWKGIAVADACLLPRDVEECPVHRAVIHYEIADHRSVLRQHTRLLESVPQKEYSLDLAPQTQ